MKKIIIAATIFCLSMAYLSQSAIAEIRIGVNAARGELQVVKEWSELANYLSSELGQPVKLIPLTAASFLGSIERKEVDFLLANPVQSVHVNEKNGFTYLATLNKKTGSQFAGVIIAKKGNGITKASDLKGKNVMSRDPKTAAGAFLFQAYHLHKQGIDVRKDLASLKEGQKQDDLVLAVKAGVIDAAFIRSGMLETMEKEGKIKIDDFVIVDQRTTANFPFIHTTELYPEWFFSASPKTDSKTANKVKTAILKITPDSKAAAAANINGFVEPIPTDGLKKAMKAMKIAPYDK